MTEKYLSNLTKKTRKTVRVTKIKIKNLKIAMTQMRKKRLLEILKELVYLMRRNLNRGVLKTYTLSKRE